MATNLKTLRLLDLSSAFSRGSGSICSLKNVGRRRKLYVRAGGGARTSEDTLCGRGDEDIHVSIVHFVVICSEI